MMKMHNLWAEFTEKMGKAGSQGGVEINLLKGPGVPVGAIDRTDGDTFINPVLDCVLIPGPIADTVKNGHFMIPLF